MQATANAKLNKYEYIRMPLGLPKIAASAVLLVSDIFSFTGKDKNGGELSCKRTYKTFTERIGKSRATVGRALKAAKDKHLIKRDKDKGYICEIGKPTEFLRCPLFIQKETFTIRKKKRKLLPNECRVYAYMFTHCDNRKNKLKVCYVSISELAETLHLCEKTVRRALWALMRADLFHCPEEDKGVNGYKVSRYTLNTEILRAHGVSIRENDERTPAPEPETPQEWTPQSIEQYYYDKCYKAARLAELNLARANKSEAFRLANEWYNKLAIELSFAEIRGEDVTEKARKYKQAQAERLIALREIGLSESDLSVQYDCKLCNDTGYRLDTGQRCKCFPPGGKA